MQQANLALLALGQMPSPDGRKLPVDLQAAKMFIDQLEMLAAKTRGNLTTAESGLLQNQLTAARLAFVSAIEQPLHGSHHVPVEPGPETGQAKTAGKSTG